MEQVTLAVRERYLGPGCLAMDPAYQPLRSDPAMKSPPKKVGC